MNQYKEQLQVLYSRVPRRHTAEHVQEINNIIDEYEEILGRVESLDAWHEKNTAVFYPSLEQIRANIKLSNSSKHAKKAKDNLFDEASGLLKDDIQSLVTVLDEGSRKT